MVYCVVYLFLRIVFIFFQPLIMLQNHHRISEVYQTVIMNWKHRQIPDVRYVPSYNQGLYRYTVYDYELCHENIENRRRSRIDSIKRQIRNQLYVNRRLFPGPEFTKKLESDLEIQLRI